jgi:Terminase RNaseH-like domain
MAPRPTRWIELFHEFIKPLRIFSKEVLSAHPGGTPLDLWHSQQRFLNELALGLDEGVRFFVCLKSRQLGITTVSLVIDVFWCAMYPGTRAALVTDTESNRDANRQIIEGYIKSFPRGYFGTAFTIKKANRNFIEFSNGSVLMLLVAGTKKKGVSWAEGKGYSFAHLTEVSKYGDPDALASFMESLAQKNPDRLFVVESTANGFNHFRNMWAEAKRDVATMRAFFIGWWASDVNFIDETDKRFYEYGMEPPSAEERDRIRLVRQMYGHVITPQQLAWIRWKEAGDHSGSILAQNQPWIESDAFIQTGFSFFQTRLLNQDIQHIDAVCELGGDIVTEYDYKPYRYELGNDFWAMKLEKITPETRELIELRVWEEPKPDGKYVIGCDPAWGRNEHKDRHAISVWRTYADKMVQVAEYATSQVEVKHCAWVLAHLAGAYKDCIVNVEIQGPGRALMMEWDHLRDLLKAEQYAKLSEERDWDEALDNARWYIYRRADSQAGAGGAYNFETNWKTKSEICHQMRGAYMTRELHIRSKPLLNEMCLVVQDGTEIGAPESSSEDCKDDRVFACALAVRAWINWRRSSQIANNETYQRVSEEEAGTATATAKSVNNIVYRFFKRKDEEAEIELPRAPQWKLDRGLA